MAEEGKRIKTGFSLRTDILKAIRHLAVEEDTDINLLIEEGMQLLLASHSLVGSSSGSSHQESRPRRQRKQSPLPITVYCLSDPRTNQVCYVGYTIDVERRRRDYEKGLPHSRALTRWLTELRQLHLRPLLTPVESFEGTLEEALQRETHWMNKLRREGAPLLNAQEHRAG